LSLSDLAGYRRHVEPGAVTFRTDLHAVAHAGLVLVTVKSGATAAVAAELAAALTRPTVVLSLQNGLRNADVLRRHLPAHVVLAGMVPFNVVQTPPAAFHQGSSGLLMAQPDPRLAPQGEVIALAAELGREAPVNARLLALIREAEERRVAITGEELLAELRAAESTPRNPRP
jgi:2-dehydropantoate 2-reductase